jgi:hypothetical protein
MRKIRDVLRYRHRGSTEEIIGIHLVRGREEGPAEGVVQVRAARG